MTAQDSRARQTECDLLVVGSGAGGLSAATTAAWHGLRVVLVEKDRVCGGATAWSGNLKRGRTLDELARKCGIDPTGLKRTIGQFNRHARNGEDPEFGRGSTPFNRGSGDPDHKPNPPLAPIRKPPFYAIKVLPGSFGTFAGLRTDARARVLNAVGDPVPGLYAVGCDQASVMGGHYPSGGINIGPALTFGYIAGRHCAGATEYENRGPAPQNDGV